MKLAMQLAALLLLASIASFATGSWSGYLVDAKCYETARGNVGPGYTSTSNRDMDLDIKLCPPKEKTKSFALVRFDWNMFKFDAAGNTKAVEFLHNTTSQKAYVVTITGDIARNVIKVDSITAGKLK
jgi:hypothetical protein